MAQKEYGQFCGLARAAEIVGQRWTLLILRDLRVGPRRYSDLVAGLPGIPTNTLAGRLKELEEDGLVERSAGSRSDRTLIYSLTPRGEELGPAMDALSRWGAGGMRTPREGEIVTTASIVGALHVAAGDGVAPDEVDTTYTVRVGDIEAQVIMRDGRIVVAPGAADHPDLIISAGPAIRDLLAGVLGPDDAIASGAVELEGDAAAFPRFVRAMHVPYSPHVAA